MGLLKSMFSRKKLDKNISIFAFWTEETSLPKKVFIGPFAKIYKSKIGDYTRVRHFCTIAYANIGKFCSIARGVKIGVAGHPTNLVSTNSVFYLDNSLNDSFKNIVKYEPYKKITIGNDVWLGEESLVMGGVNIGDGAIIAAHAVVTKDVPPYAIVGGVPAKVVKYRFSPEVIDALMDLKWWEWSDNTIRENKSFFAIENLQLGDVEKIKKKIM